MVNLLLSTRPNTQSIDLSSRYHSIIRLSKLSDISQLIPIFQKFIKLTELNLSNNNIANIPEEINSLSLLKYLNIMGNPISDFEKLTTVLGALPNLQELEINLSATKDAALILTNMPKLKILNRQGIRKYYNSDR